MQAASPLTLVLLALSMGSAGCTLRDTDTSAPGATGTSPQEPLVIPFLTARPRLDGSAEEPEWASTRPIPGIFDIRDGSPAEGVYEGVLRVGATPDGLHLLAQMDDLPKNPWDSAGATHSDCVILSFTDDADRIARPSFSVGACAGVSGYSTTHPAYWNGADWVIDEDPPGRFNEGYPEDGAWAYGTVQDGLMSFEVYLPRFPTNPERNGVRFGDGATVRMGVTFMRLGGGGPETHSPDARGLFYGPHDAFPGEGYTPHGAYDPRGWLRLRMPG